jgi:hypothetical protein
MVQRWIRELYWNVLDMKDIQNYILFGFIYGLDYLVYFTVAVIRHLRQLLLDASRKEQLIFALQDAKLAAGFSSAAELPFMDSLKNKHRKSVLPDLSK